MKKLILMLLSVFLLTARAHSQQQQPTVNVDVSPKPKVSVNVSKPNVSVNTDVNVVTNVNVQDSEPLKVKTFSKSFSLDKNDKVNLSNQYGSITIKTWDKNEIKVDADIKAYADNDSEAQKLLENASINATKTGDLVSFKTIINDRSSSSWSYWGSGSKNGKKWRREVKVYITVYMPSSNSLTASQSYGNIVMDNFSGPTSLKVQYGNLTTGNLSNNNNYISVGYGKAVAKDIDQAKIKLEYGSGLSINSVGNLDLDVAYANVNIAALKGNVTSKIEYGKLNINEIGNGCKIVDVKADYTDVNLGFNTSYSGEFNVATSYGGFKYGANVIAKKQGDDKGYSNSKSYSGQIGKGGVAKINITTEYGSVTFK
jgi:uncharacterized protein YcfL